MPCKRRVEFTWTGIDVRSDKRKEGTVAFIVGEMETPTMTMAFVRCDLIINLRSLTFCGKAFPTPLTKV
jgi:hypothetical protein